MNQPGPEQGNPIGLQPPKLPDRGHWGYGVGFAFACIVMVIPLAIVVGVIGDQFQSDGAIYGLIALAVFGLLQWVFVIPVGIFLHSRGKGDTAMGLWITAGVAMLLNGACFGLMTL